MLGVLWSYFIKDNTFVGESGDEYSINSFKVVDLSQMNEDEFTTWCCEYERTYNTQGPVLLDYGGKSLPNNFLNILYDKWDDHSKEARKLEGHPSYMIDIVSQETWNNKLENNLREFFVVVPSCGWKKTYIGC